MWSVTAGLLVGFEFERMKPIINNTKIYYHLPITSGGSGYIWGVAASP